MSNAVRTSTTATKPFKGEFTRPCTRCGGTGAFGPTVVYQGRCFRCQGGGVDPKPGKEWVFPASWSGDLVQEFLDKKEAAKVARSAKKVDKRIVKMEAQMAAHPSVAALRTSWLAEDHTPEAALWYAVSNAARDIMWKCFQYDLSEKQVALLDEQVAKATAYLASKVEREAAQAAAKAAALPVPTGRVTIIGTVVSRKWYDGDFGSTCKLLLVGADGWKVFVTEPRSLNCQVGDVVTLTCSVQASADDRTFGKGKNPTKGSIVSEAVAS